VPCLGALADLRATGEHIYCGIKKMCITQVSPAKLTLDLALHHMKSNVRQSTQMEKITLTNVEEEEKEEDDNEMRLRALAREAAGRAGKNAMAEAEREAAEIAGQKAKGAAQLAQAQKHKREKAAEEAEARAKAEEKVWNAKFSVSSLMLRLHFADVPAYNARSLESRA
jgi:hypothetical protein